MDIYNVCTESQSLLSMPNSFNSGRKSNQSPTGNFKICKVLDEGPGSTIIYIHSDLGPSLLPGCCSERLAS